MPSAYYVEGVYERWLHNILNGNRTFRPLDVSPLGRFAPRTFRPWTFRHLDVSPTHWTFRPRLWTFRPRLLYYVFVAF